MLRLLSALMLVSVAACASRGGPPEGAREARIDQTGILVAHARKIRSEKGCAAAAPALRVAAAMGSEQAAAQHELGECLMSLEGASETETALFRREGEFWLTRAAYAGSARAQRFLAAHYGAAVNSEAERAEALKWTLVYNANPEAELYGFKALPETFEPGLRNSLPADKIAEAEAFAAEFEEIALAGFEPPRLEQGRGAMGEGRGRPPGGTRRRR